MKKNLLLIAFACFLPTQGMALVLSGTSGAYDVQASSSADVDLFVGVDLELALLAGPLNQVQGVAPPYDLSSTLVNLGTGVAADGLLTQNLGVGAGTAVDHFQAFSDADALPGPRSATAEGNIASAAYSVDLAGLANILTVGAVGSGVGGLITTTASVGSLDGGATLTPSGTSNLLASGVTVTVLGLDLAELGITLVSGQTSTAVLNNLNIAGIGTVSGTVSVGLNLFDVTGLSLSSATATSTALRVGLDLSVTTLSAVTDIATSLTVNQSTASLITNAVPEPSSAWCLLAAGLIALNVRKRGATVLP